MHYMLQILFIFISIFILLASEAALKPGTIKVRVQPRISPPFLQYTRLGNVNFTENEKL